MSVRWQLYHDSCRPPLGLWPPLPPPVLRGSLSGSSTQLSKYISGCSFQPRETCQTPADDVLSEAPRKRGFAPDSRFGVPHQGASFLWAWWLLWCRTVKLLNPRNQSVSIYSFVHIYANICRIFAYFPTYPVSKDKKLGVRLGLAC